MFYLLKVIRKKERHQKFRLPALLTLFLLLVWLQFKIVSPATYYLTHQSSIWDRCSIEINQNLMISLKNRSSTVLICLEFFDWSYYSQTIFLDDWIISFSFTQSCDMHTQLKTFAHALATTLHRYNNIMVFNSNKFK